MALALENLDQRTRQLMLDEARSDISSGRLYISGRLSERGCSEYADLLLAAIDHDTDETLGQTLSAGPFLAEFEVGRRGDKTFRKRVPKDAAETLAEGEFNRFYLRGLARRAIEDGVSALEIYRAKPVRDPRPESEARIGALVDPTVLLADLRAHPGVDTALGLPSPNSGLSARLPKAS